MAHRFLERIEARREYIQPATTATPTDDILRTPRRDASNVDEALTSARYLVVANEPDAQPVQKKTAGTQFVWRAVG